MCGFLCQHNSTTAFAKHLKLVPLFLSSIPILGHCKKFLSLPLHRNALLNVTNGFLIPKCGLGHIFLRHLISYLRYMTVDDSSFLTQFMYLGLDVNTVLISASRLFLYANLLILLAPLYTQAFSWVLPTRTDSSS